VNKKYWWLLIILTAIFWRFWEFGNRWVLNQDQARDAVIGLYSIRNGAWPELGSPSSAGPFNFGPWYDYIIMFWEIIIPTIMGPWIGFGIMSVFSVIMYAKIGQLLYGKKGLVFFGLVAGMAVGQVENSPDMLNTVIVGVSGISAMWCGLKLIKTEKWWWATLTGMAVGLSINFHFQAMGGLGWLLALVLVNKFDLIKRFKWALEMFLGLVIAFWPLLVFDIKRNGVWIKSVIEYYTIGVNRFYTPVRWLTEIKDFWPQLFGAVITGVNNHGYIILSLAMILLFIMLIKKIKIDKFWMVMGVMFFIQILLMRNYKGVRSREYMITFHSMIILITSWITMEFYKLNKYVGLLILGGILLIASINNWRNIYKYPSQAKDVEEIKKQLDEKIEGKVRVFQYRQSDMIALPLFYLYYFENRIGDQNKLWVCDGNRYECPQGEIILKNKYRIYETDQKWDEITAENVYDRLMVNYGKK